VGIGILGILRRLLSRRSPSQAQDHGPLGVAQDDKGLGVFMRWQSNGRVKCVFASQAEGRRFLLW
jgi:hypothetical protein